MAKLFIVCPNCSAKYPVADQKLAGRKVTCKKCSQKFVAEVQGAAPPAEEEFAPIPADDPFASSTSAGDNLFGDFPASESASSAPALGSLPSKQKQSSSSGFAVVPILLSVARVTGVAIVVIITYSSLFPTPGSGQAAPKNDTAFGRQTTPKNDASFGGQPAAQNDTAFGGTSGGVPAERGGGTPPPREVSDPPAPEDPSPAQPSAPAEEPIRPNYDPFGGRNGPPGPRGVSDSVRAFARDPIGQMTKDYGADKIVRIEAKSISSEQSKKMAEVLKPMMIARTYARSYDRDAEHAYFVFPYDGDVRELASKIDFGEVDEIDVQERRIRYKSLNLP